MQRTSARSREPKPDPRPSTQSADRIPCFGVVLSLSPFTNSIPGAREKLLRGIPSYKNSLYGSNNYIANERASARILSDDHTNRTKPSDSEESGGAWVWQNKCLCKLVARRPLVWRCWGGSIYNFRKESFTDYVETYQLSFYDSHS